MRTIGTITYDETRERVRIDLTQLDGKKLWIECFVTKSDIATVLDSRDNCQFAGDRFLRPALISIINGYMENHK